MYNMYRTVKKGVNYDVQRQEWFIEDLKREFIDRTDDLDESFTETDVKQIIERVKAGCND